MWCLGSHTPQNREVHDKSLSRSELTTRQELAFPWPKLHSGQLRTGNFLLHVPCAF